MTNKPQSKNLNNRVFEIDFVRGALIVFMCLEHLCYFFYRYAYVGVWNRAVLSETALRFADWCNWFLFESDIRVVLRAIGLALFFVLSGISSTFSKNNYMRALKIFSFFLFLYLIAFVAQNYIYYPIVLDFGVFLAYAVCIVVFQIINKAPLWTHIALTGILLVLSVFAHLYFPDFCINPLRWFGVSQKLNLHYLDEYPIFPSIFLYGIGIILGKTIYKQRKSYLEKLNNYKALKPITWVGKNSLIVYGVHYFLYPAVFIIISIILS